MKDHLMAIIISAVFVVGIGMTPVFGQMQMQDAIVVTTDKESYSDGETIIITGQVRDMYSRTPISVVVTAPNGNLVNIGQLDIVENNRFIMEVTAGGPLIKFDGVYTIKVQYGNNLSATTSFEFKSSAIVPDDNKGEDEIKMWPAIADATDQIEYMITGGTIQSITPDIDSPSLIIKIDATSDGMLTITIPRTILDSTTPDGEDDDFFVLIDFEEANDFGEERTSKDTTFVIEFQEGSEEIEIIGTFVIPEFGTIAAMILAVAIISIIAISARSRLSIMPRY